MLPVCSWFLLSQSLIMDFTSWPRPWRVLELCHLCRKMHTYESHDLADGCVTLLCRGRFSDQLTLSGAGGQLRCFGCLFPWTHLRKGEKPKLHSFISSYRNNLIHCSRTPSGFVVDFWFVFVWVFLISLMPAYFALAYISYIKIKFHLCSADHSLTFV